LIVNRSPRRSPNLRIEDRLIAGFCSLWIKPNRFPKVAIVFKPSTLLSFHRALVQRKYLLLFFRPRRPTKPGPKGPADFIGAVVEMKKRNPTWGSPRLPLRSTWLSEPLLIRMWFGVSSLFNTCYFDQLFEAGCDTSSSRPDCTSGTVTPTARLE
jgi:hypothetical protein